MTDAVLTAVLRRDRAMVVIAIVVITVLAWAYILWLAAQMGIAEVSTAATAEGAMAGMHMPGGSGTMAGMDMGAAVEPAFRTVGRDRHVQAIRGRSPAAAVQDRTAGRGASICSDEGREAIPRAGCGSRRHGRTTDRRRQLAICYSEMRATDFAAAGGISPAFRIVEAVSGDARKPSSASAASGCRAALVIAPAKHGASVLGSRVVATYP
jgi:hypothetical protein